jgi:hypothetical protein
MQAASVQHHLCESTGSVEKAKRKAWRRAEREGGRWDGGEVMKQDRKWEGEGGRL